MQDQITIGRTIGINGKPVDGTGLAIGIHSPTYGNTMASFLVEAKPVGKLNEVVHTIFGLAHDQKLVKKGRPGIWHGIAIGKELSNDTYFSSPPVAIQRFMFRLFGKTATAKGYKAIYPEYGEDDFWRRKVEQIVN